jgi:hypothetical protein
VEDFEDLDYYGLLGIERNATADEIKRAYRQQILRYHPDRFARASADEQEYARARTLRINEAYSTLSDFAARSAYNRSGGPAARPTVQAPPRPQAPPPPRDHQAELYNQGRAHIEAGRYVQALAILRQLQQVNPFYRDTAALVAMVEAQLHPEKPDSAPAPVGQQQQQDVEDEDQNTTQRTRRWVLGGALGSAAIAAAVAAVVGLRGQASRLWSGEPTSRPEPTPLVTAEAPVAAGPTSVPSPLSTPRAAPTQTVSPSPQPSATAVPTEAPTVVPTSSPPPTAEEEEEGDILLDDSFSRGGWPSLEGTGWSVGYARGGRYRIVASPGAGNIWSYRTLGATNYSLGVDVQADNGSAGVIVRFQDRSNYVVCLIDPSQGRYRVEQRSRGRLIVVGEGNSTAINTGPGASNRVVARVEGSQLTMLVNGTPVVEAEVAGMPRTQQYGMVAAAGQGSVEALFDNLQARTQGE